jgi:3-dehydroquinate dehydratase/shikimate dehydrogenase
LIFAMRTREHGGCAESADPSRADRLGDAAVAHDLVELEAPHDLTPEVLAKVPPDRRLICWRGPAEGHEALERRLRWLTGIEAPIYLLEVASQRFGDGLAPLELLHTAGRSDVVALADGEVGLWSRVLSPLLGAPLVFGRLDEEDKSAEPTVARLVEDFGLPDPGQVQMTFGIVGHPVAHSLSPRLHNASYRAMGLSALFLPLPVKDFGPFWDEMVLGRALDRLGLPLRGLTVSSPHKEEALASASAAKSSAHHAGSANLVYLRRGHWVADTTDPTGVLSTLTRRGIPLAGRRAAVIGCGGSGRAIAWALARAGANVVLSNRSRARGELASHRLGLPLVELSRFSPAEFDVLINATPVGRDSADLPFSCNELSADAVVVDLVYSKRPTPLAVAATARGARVIDGHEVLLIQTTRQFEKMTGTAIRVELMAGHLGRRWEASTTTGPGASWRHSSMVDQIPVERRAAAGWQSMEETA